MQVTYNNRQLVKNTELIPCKTCGRVHEYWTKGCIPVMIPDHWNYPGFEVVEAPNGIITRFAFDTPPKAPMAISKFDIFDVGPRL